MLAEPNVSVDLTVAAKIALGGAQLGSGQRAAGSAALADALQTAAKSGSAPLIAESKLAHAEALAAAGQAQSALDAAGAAQQWFAGAGNSDAEWRAWLAASVAEKALGRAGESQESARRAQRILATLEQKWDAESYHAYLNRPDIQERRSQLVKLAADR